MWDANEIYNLIYLFKLLYLLSFISILFDQIPFSFLIVFQDVELFHDPYQKLLYYLINL